MNSTVNNNDLNVKYQDLDSSELFVLQNAYKSMQNFLDLTCGAVKGNVKDNKVLDMNNNGQSKLHDPIVAVLNPNKDPQVPSKRRNMPLKALFVPNNVSGENHEYETNGSTSNEVMSCVANDLVMSQDQLKRLSVRLEILETLQVII